MNILRYVSIINYVFFIPFVIIHSCSVIDKNIIITIVLMYAIIYVIYFARFQRLLNCASSVFKHVC